MGRTTRREDPPTRNRFGKQPSPAVAGFVTLLIAALGVLFLVAGVGSASKEFTLRYQGTATQAQIVTIQTGGKHLECEVSFTDPKEISHLAWLEGQCRGMAVGQSIPVKYLAADPTTVAAAGTLSLMKILIPVLAETIFGLLCLFFSVLGVLSGLGKLEPWAARRRHNGEHEATNPQRGRVES